MSIILPDTDERKSLVELKARVDTLERKLAELPKSSIIVPISTFAPEPFDLLKEIKVVVRSCDDEFLATFFDANVNASGCNETDAVNSLKEMLLRRFDYLDRMPTEKIGPCLSSKLPYSELLFGGEFELWQTSTSSWRKKSSRS